MGISKVPHRYLIAYSYRSHTLRDRDGHEKTSFFSSNCLVHSFLFRIFVGKIGIILKQQYYLRIMKRTKWFLILWACLLPFMAQAGRVTEQQALQRAQQFMRQQGG